MLHLYVTAGCCTALFRIKHHQTERLCSAGNDPEDRNLEKEGALSIPRCLTGARERERQGESRRERDELCSPMLSTTFPC